MFQMLAHSPVHKRHNELQNYVLHFIGIASEVSESVGDFSNVFIQSDAIRLTVIPSFNGGECFGVFFYEGGEFEHKTATICGRQISP